MSIQEIASIHANNLDCYQASGGNVSCKIGDLILIKKSGFRINEITESEGYITLPLSEIKTRIDNLFKLDFSDKDLEDKYLEIISKYRTSHSQPSMELAFHLSKHKFVMHSHPTIVNALTCSIEGQEILRREFKGEALFIPYTKPGIHIAKSIWHEEKEKNESIIFLFNHGLIISGESIQEISAKYSYIEKKLAQHIPCENDAILDSPGILFPDAAVFPDDLETNENHNKVYSLIKQMNFTPIFLSSTQVDSVLEMEQEKFRQKELSNKTKRKGIKVLIPMSGEGRRFINYGYTTPKPLIEVDGKPIIQHIVNQFDPENDEFIFICNEKHFKETNIKNILLSICKNSKIHVIPGHKLGPVHTVLAIQNYIEDDEGYIINYCDFSWRWNYKEFLKQMRESNCDASIIGYKGFHPHLLIPKNLYASMRVNDNFYLEEIREKFSFTPNKMDCFQSSGTHYFSKGSLIKKYFNQLVQKNIKVNDEFFVSLVFEEMRKDNKSILVHEISTFLQWGTPEDLADYNYWATYFRNPHGPERKFSIKGLIALIPMAGNGERFKKAGYSVPKPLIKIDNKAMIVHAASSLPRAERYFFVCQSDHIDQLGDLKSNFHSSQLIPIKYLTEGQAATCLIAKDYISQDSPLVIGACDNGMTWNEEKFELARSKFDALIFTFKNHPVPVRSPEMCGWVRVGANNIAQSVSCKQAISDNPSGDHAIVGCFYFNRAQNYFDAAEKLIHENRRIRNEFYIDEAMNILIEDGLSVGVFEVDKYLGFGTPGDLETYMYWKKFFNNEYHE